MERPETDFATRVIVGFMAIASIFIMLCAFYGAYRWLVSL